ncbi:Saposin-like type B, 2 domain and Saposin B domain and Saposin-like domain-containing protein [Strongyloides ratti]|uniref:Saposin-like type B, 2 domain and Saposin B domain and Saposin-like domain-containing protein n=1 Tax=Strongyloides ratti TaxID=34506 RepID=A0A090LGG3_STRRB|nr:Saposin-like type B, 2 domain and Saposin B domain and Saposin-like domain-containing protein [Strongyloides ratti]CEF68896.1 Saposin-like type B, 2 domain and Saposin B domain and Saposin-like domain-containing protein [Strongyloides ratti]
MKFLTLFTIFFLIATINANLICQLCLDFCKDLEKELESDEPDMEKKANAICDRLTHNSPLLDNVCKQLVDSELQTVVGGLEQNEPPQKICQGIGMC